jgi:replicative DNA helicase
VRLKNLAVELGITIIALSQLARANPGGNNKPLMSQLKEAGEIENSADNVYLVYRAELYGETYPDDWATYSTAGTALVFHTKARSGAIGDFIIGFQPECVRYFDMDHVERVKDNNPY